MMEFSEFDLSCFSLDKLSGLLERGSGTHLKWKPQAHLFFGEFEEPALSSFVVETGVIYLLGSIETSFSLMEDHDGVRLLLSYSYKFPHYLFL